MTREERICRLRGIYKDMGYTIQNRECGAIIATKDGDRFVIIYKQYTN